ncbi:MAG TPA: hypothetical protein VH857_00750 [Actinomycetes bacterium]|nr:hypothetical protein [Actinomycetes bacterium]
MHRLDVWVAARSPWATSPVTAGPDVLLADYNNGLVVLRGR